MKKEALISFLFVIINIIVMVIVIVISRGYKFDSTSGSIHYSGSLMLDSEPQGANVLLNDKEYGITPLKIDALDEGTYRIELKRDGFFDLQSEVEIKDRFVTKKYYTLLKNGSVFTKMLDKQSTSYIRDSNSSNLIYSSIGKNETVIGQIRLPETNLLFTTGIKDSSIISEKNDPTKIDRSFYYSSATNKLYILSKSEFLLLDILTEKETDLSKQIGFIPETLFIDVDGNVFLFYSNNIYLYDEQNNSLIQKYLIKKDEKVVLNKKIFIISNSEIKILSSTSQTNDFIKFPISDMQLKKDDVFLDISGDHLVISSNSKLFLYNLTSLKYTKTTIHSQIRNVSKTRSDIFISTDNKYIYNIDFITENVKEREIDLTDSAKYVVAPNKDFALIIDKNKLYLASPEIGSKSELDIPLPTGKIIDIWMDNYSSTYVIVENSTGLSSLYELPSNK